MVVLEKVKELPYTIAILLHGIYETNICTSMFIAALLTINKRRKQLKFERLIKKRKTDKQNVVCPYNGIIFSLKKKEILP